ncbi:hypothetical protein ABTD83_22080, partial [Acinetobacter baumannii]
RLSYGALATPGKVRGCPAAVARTHSGTAETAIRLPHTSNTAPIRHQYGSNTAETRQQYSGGPDSSTVSLARPVQFC